MYSLNLLGLCRRAGKLSAGHDAVKISLRKKNAKLVIIAADASDRLRDEIERLADGVPVLSVSETIDELSLLTGRKAAVMTVDDENFANGITKDKQQED